MPHEPGILIQTAMAEETRAVARAGRGLKLADGYSTLQIGHRQCRLLESGIGPLAAAQTLAAHLDRSSPPAVVISAGLAGGLDPHMHIGQRWLIRHISSTASDHYRLSADLHCLPANLLGTWPVTDLLTISQVACTPTQKLHLRQQWSAGLCDMESYAVASLCRQRHIPWMGLRVVSDTARETLPSWITQLPALVASGHWFRLLGLVASHPQDLTTLVRLGLRIRQLTSQLTQSIQELVPQLHVPVA